MYTNGNNIRMEAMVLTEKMMDLMKSSFSGFCWMTFWNIGADVDINRMLQKRYKIRTGIDVDGNCICWRNQINVGTFEVREKKSSICESATSIRITYSKKKWVAVNLRSFELIIFDIIDICFV